MDAQRSSISGTGFDAALRALDELESDVALTRESAPAPVAIAPAIGAIEMIDFDLASDDIAPEPVSAPAPSAPDVRTAAPVELIALDLDLDLDLDLGPTPPPRAEIAAPPVPQPAEPAHVETLSLPIDAAPAGPLAAQPAAVPAKRSILPALAVGLALFSSVVSAVGLVVVSRTVVGAALVVADARERQEQMKKVAVLVHDLEAIRTRQTELLHRQELAAAAPLLTTKDLETGFAELQRGMIERDQSKAMLAMVHEGQSQLNDTLVSIGNKATRIEAKLDNQH